MSGAGFIIIAILTLAAFREPWEMWLLVLFASHP